MENATGFTNYYTIKDKNNSYFIGEKDFAIESPHDIYGEDEKKSEEKDIRFGWEQISSDDIRVVYLNSLIDEYRGNNPHVGYGQYDSGETYFKYFKEIFKYSIENALKSECKYNED